MSTLTPKTARWAAVCKQVLARDGHTCAECGDDRDLTVDHVVPLVSFTEEDWAAGREYDSSNLMILCRRCNARKGARTAVRQDWCNSRWLDHL